MATISRPDPTDYTDAPWTDQNGQRWLADSKGRWSIYVDPPDAGGGGGASAYTDLTDAATAALPTINTPLSSALALKAPLASPTFTGTVTIPSGASISGYLTTATAASTYAPQIRTASTVSANFAVSSASNGVYYNSGAPLTMTLPAASTLLGLKFWILAEAGDVTISGSLSNRYDFATVSTITADDGRCEIENVGGDWVLSRGVEPIASHTHSGADITTGNIAVARITTALTTPGPIGGTTPAAISATTVTASGAVTCGSEGTSNTLTVGSQTANSSTAKIRINGKSGGGTALHGEWVMRSNAYFALDTYGATDAIRVDASNGRVAFTRGIEGNTFHNGFLTIGTAAITTEDDGLLVVNKGYSTASGNHHAIRVKSTDSVLASGAGINFFDAQATISSNNNIDHIAEFQARSTKSGSGTMNDWFGYWTNPIFSAGTTTRAAHVHIEDATGAGTLTTQYGLRIKPLTKGGTNYGVVVEGSNPSVFGGTTPNANAQLDVQSTTKAFMPPRMTTSQKNAIASPTAGMMVYDTTLNKLSVYTTAWETVTSI